MKMSDEEDTTILLKNASQNPEATTSKPVDEGRQCVPVKKQKKPVFKENNKNVAPLSAENQNILISVVATIAGTAFGYDMGIGKQISPLVENDLELDPCEVNVSVYSWFLGALFGSLLGGILVDKCGRRSTMMLALSFLMFGSLMSALASHLAILVVARWICGMFGTVSAMSHCVYMAEVSEPKKRGCNVSLHQLGTALGLVLSVILVAGKNADDQWRLFVGITAVPALVSLAATVIFLQRSPPFLLLQRKVYVTKPAQQYSWGSIYETLAVMVFMLVLQQSTGRMQVLFYAPRLFGLLGICSNVAEVTTSIALGIVKLFSSFLALIIVERCGRRTALITSATICMTTISLLALLATLDRGDDGLILASERCMNLRVTIHDAPKSIVPLGSPPPFPLLPTPLAISAPVTETWTQVRESCETQNVMTSEGLTAGLRILAVITLLVYESAYALGLGPVPFLTLSEVFPSRIRGKCVGFCVMILWVVHLIFSESLVYMTKSMTLAGTYLLYSFLCLITVFYVFLFYPETKGKTLHQIAQELRKVSLLGRVYNNLRSLPMICHLDWITKFRDKKNAGESTLI